MEGSTQTLGQFLANARLRLAESPREATGREASLLAQRILGVDEAYVLAHPERLLAAEEADALEALLRRRLRGEPVAYLLGEREFYGRAFRVDQRVLIPRPETEHLVEAVLSTQLPEGGRVLELGTGSGCIAVTLAAERPDLEVVATDRSIPALNLARSNARRWGATVRWVAADWLAALAVRSFDAVVSNPPYVARNEASALSPEITEHEPHQALFADGPRGLGVLEELTSQATRLAPGGVLALEVGLGQSDLVAGLMEKHDFALEKAMPDLAGIPRVVVGIRRGN